MSQIILSGGRPTGALHLGHYIGAIKKLVEIQHTGKCYFVISNLHFLSTRCIKSEIKKLPQNINKLMIDCMGMGVSLDCTDFYLQSEIPEITYIHALIQNMISAKRANSTPSLQVMKSSIYDQDIPLGLLSYPVLEAADIISMQADQVVVGRDNIDHLAITNEIVERLNVGFDTTFKKPQCISNEKNFMIGIDGKYKMSKSLNNAILLDDSLSIIQQKISKAPWYPYDDKANTNAIMQYIDLFDPDRHEADCLLEKFRNREAIEKEAKELTVKIINDVISPIRERILGYSENPALLEKHLCEGTEHAREIISGTLTRLKSDMGFLPLKK